MEQIKERIGKLIEDIGQLRYQDEFSNIGFKMLKSDEKLEDIKNLNTDSWADFKENQLWGGDLEYFWFETIVTIPEQFDGKCVVFELSTGKEGEWDAINPQFAVYIDGMFRQGFDVNHREIVLSESAKWGENYRIILSAFTGTSNFRLTLNARLRVLDCETEKYYYDLLVPYENMKLLEQDDKNYLVTLKCLNESLNLVDLRCEYSEEYYNSLHRAQNYLMEEFYEKHCGESESTVCCIGHTHIDVAWLWTLEVTKDKVARSFSTVIEMMEKYPEYKFMASQPQLLDYVKKNVPELFEKIKEKIREGRFEVEGGMWLEADCNLTSGESLVRQFLHGKKFMKDEFDKDNIVLWLPDVFGYSAALPQIMKKSGIKYFVTSKISWSEFNQMPFDTFLWQGIDGSEILSHFITTQDYKVNTDQPINDQQQTTYVGKITPSHVKGCWRRYSQKHMNNEVMLSFGYGDGGGGPTKEMLEYARRMEKGLPGCPKTVNGTLDDFMMQLEQRVSGQKHLPTWVGELYLEYHRGTYTSMGRNKKYNRRTEFAYQNAELYAMIDRELLGGNYPTQTIREAWEVILRNQFHDILPGSSIKEVYDDSKLEYEKIIKWNEELLRDSLEHIVAKIDIPQNSVVIFNPNGFPCDDIVQIPDMDAKENLVAYSGNSQVPLQKTAEDKLIFMAEKIPAKGYKTYYLKQEVQPSEMMKITKHYLENQYFEIELNQNGQFSRFYDKIAHRDILKQNECGNVIMSYEDRPHNFDAWDLAIYYPEKSWEITQVDSIEVIEEGPVRGVLAITRSYLNSKIIQYITIYNQIPRVDIKNCIDWKEKQIFLKLFFPVEIHANEATYDIQFGNVKRPTHKNTSWDAAKFEVCAHKWIDISEEGYGVSILNDCKYGYSIEENVIGLSMLKSGIYPNPEADKEYHEFTYSILPHQNGWREANIIQRAYEFNNSLAAVVKQNEGGILEEQFSFVTVDCDNVIVETIKKAEDNDDIVVRIYEAHNKRNYFTLNFCKEIDYIVECDLMENQIGDVEFHQNMARGSIKPYEIKTFRVRMKQ
ncbi:alpha-mannosidase [Lachnoclostridium sp.]|uniref:alpha-mannosidase n=1 Tax=Lachnoclostridium sp. TaxID=2028282 RepID=UPI0028969625|nr:glycoside hydrolase family 38 C-terminal domain-containing protein [Lachnoclostridium sp.]